MKLDHPLGAGQVQDIKWRSAPSRARIAFARLREANIIPERLLAIHMAVSALIEDDAGSHRVTEYRIAQVAKAAHRLASGTHRHWDFPLDNGGTAPLAFHAYPRSSGRVLRVIGKAIEECCEMVTGRETFRPFATSSASGLDLTHPSCPGGSPYGSGSARRR